MVNKAIRFKHFANIGDIAASLAAMKSFYENSGKKVIYCQQLNVPADYYPGATHPTLDGANKMVMCNEKMFEMIRPLLLHQDYIEDMEIFTGQPITIDLDVIRKKTFVNIPHGAIQQWIFLAYFDLAWDLSKPWINVGEVDISECSLFHPRVVSEPLPLTNLKDKIVVNFTERYRNYHLNYFFLKEHEDKVIFAGTEGEYNLFCEAWGLSIPRLVVDDFLQLAYIIKNCKFLLSNQSFCWNVAEGMKSPRVLELCEHAPNCQPFVGEKSYGYYDQPALMYYFNKLNK